MRISWQVDNEAPAARSARPSQRAAPCGGTTTDGLREAMTFASVVLVLCVYNTGTEALAGHARRPYSSWSPSTGKTCVATKSRV